MSKLDGIPSEISAEVKRSNSNTKKDHNPDALACIVSIGLMSNTEKVLNSLFVISMLNIQPHNIHGNIMFIETQSNITNIILIIVVPAALVVSKRKQLRFKIKTSDY